MPRSHRPPKPRPSATPPAPPRTAVGLVVLALAPPAVVLAVDRPLLATLALAAVATVLVALSVVGRAVAPVAPRRIAVRVPLVSLRVEVGVARAEGCS